MIEELLTLEFFLSSKYWPILGNIVYFSHSS